MIVRYLKRVCRYNTLMKQVKNNFYKITFPDWQTWMNSYNSIIHIRLKRYDFHKHVGCDWLWRPVALNVVTEKYDKNKKISMFPTDVKDSIQV